MFERGIYMAFGMKFNELTELEQKLVVLAIGVDTLAGGDALHESGAQHFIIDTWISGMTPPKIYYDAIAEDLRQAGGSSEFSDKEAIKKYIDNYRLHELANEIRNQIEQLAPGRRNDVLSLVDALDMVLRTVDEKVESPGYDEKYKAVTGLTEVKLVDAAPYRATLKQALSKAGFEVSSDSDLRQTSLAWEKEKGHIGAYVNEDTEKINGEIVQQKFNETIQKLLAIARERLFSKIDFGIAGHQPDLSDILFTGFKFKPINNVDFTGSSIYRGQGTDVPLLQGLLEYNTDHPLTPTGLIQLAAHEAMIGHYLNSAVLDLLWRAGKLPFEATMGTMCTSSAVFQEGWAENALDIIYGSREETLKGVEKDFGVSSADLEVVLAMADLQNVAKHNVSILYQRNGMPIDDIRTYLKDECVMPDHLVKKLSGGWAQDPIIGPMYGPAYYVGTKVVREAIAEVGAKRVAEVGLQTTGRLSNIVTFREQVYQ
ncbi:MAG: hypothetical protein ABUT20_53950 [Bacteroidota bacterium]